MSCGDTNFCYFFFKIRAPPFITTVNYLVGISFKKADVPIIQNSNVCIVSQLYQNYVSNKILLLKSDFEHLQPLSH